jgi:tripeptide aminopeptidase
MHRIEQIAGYEPVRRALQSFDAGKEEIIEWIISIQQIPSPTFAEAEIARFVESAFVSLGLENVHQDSLHNVYGRLKGTDPGSRKPIVISAHCDTVFPAHTNLKIHRDDKFIYGPGIGDNATGVAGLLAVAGAVHRYDLQPASDLWFVSNVGEEGLGDLRGMREVVRRFGRQASYIVVEGGLFGQIAHQAIGVQRFRIAVQTAGGHSWGNFGVPSAIHELAHIVAAVDQLVTPEVPKTTYNIGVIEGGTSVNTIASEASMLLDLRSESAAELDGLVEAVRDIISAAKERNVRQGRETKITLEQVGNRPAGEIPRRSPLVTWARQALTYAGSEQTLFVCGSTDANIPLSMGIPSVCIGLTESANSHRLDERIDTRPLPSGLRQLLLLALAAGDYRPRT